MGLCSTRRGTWPNQRVRSVGLALWEQPAPKPLGSGASLMALLPPRNWRWRWRRDVLRPLPTSWACGGTVPAWRGKPAVPVSPHGLQVAGSWDAARALWVDAGCPYEAALCLADADDEARLRLALEELLALEARPAAAIVARRLRDRGVMSLPRGPRVTTRQTQYGLTARELEVLALMNESLQNNQIADRLVVSVRTVDHHVEAILRKLGVKTRVTPGPPPPRSG